jgi:hypothetical protein
MARDALFGPDGTQALPPYPVLSDPLAGLVTGPAVWVAPLEPVSVPPVVVPPPPPAPDQAAIRRTVERQLAEDQARRQAAWTTAHQRQQVGTPAWPAAPYAGYTVPAVPTAAAYRPVAPQAPGYAAQGSPRDMLYAAMRTQLNQASTRAERNQVLRNTRQEVARQRQQTGKKKTSSGLGCLIALLIILVSVFGAPIMDMLKTLVKSLQ